MDLITNPEEITSNAGLSARGDPVEEEVGAEERLDGSTVRAIWKLSRLERATLRVIWSVSRLFIHLSATMLRRHAHAGWNVTRRVRVRLIETAS